MYIRVVKLVHTLLNINTFISTSYEQLWIGETVPYFTLTHFKHCFSCLIWESILNVVKLQCAHIRHLRYTWT